MAVALDGLRGNMRGLESQTRANLLFDRRSEVGEDAHRARRFANSHFLGCGGKARDVALRFRIPIGQLESESDGLGMDAVSATHHRSVFELPGAALKDLCQTLQIFGDQSRGLGDEQSLRGVDNIARSEAIVKPARVRTHNLTHSRSEGDDVVPYFVLDFAEAFNSEFSTLPDGVRRRSLY